MSEIHDPDPDGNHTPRRVSEQVAHLRLLADTYDGVDAEEWAEAADTIERLSAELDGVRYRATLNRVHSSCTCSPGVVSAECPWHD